MNIYFDTEFTGLHKDTSLISMGLISEQGDKLYLEFSDYKKEQCDKWINDNVINHTIFLKKDIDRSNQKIYINGQSRYCSTKSKCSTILEKWLTSFNTHIQLVSDVCHYDMVLFIDLFGSAFNLPDFINPVCHDINQDISMFLGITEREAFDLNRESFIKQYGIMDIVGNKHNSLYDAEVIRKIYNIIHGMGK